MNTPRTKLGSVALAATLSLSLAGIATPAFGATSTNQDGDTVTSQINDADPAPAGDASGSTDTPEAAEASTPTPAAEAAASEVNAPEADAPEADAPAPADALAPTAVADDAGNDVVVIENPAKPEEFSIDAQEALKKTNNESPALASDNENPVVIDGVTQPTPVREGFRTLPYLQAPSADGMTINWFSETGTPALITITGSGLPDDGLTVSVVGVHNPVNTYQSGELSLGDRTQPGGALEPIVVEQGTWIRGAEPYKYSLRVTGLDADSTYHYTVTQDGYEHSAQFSTTPVAGQGIGDGLHIIAYSDTETDPVGRVTYREWVKNPLTDDSESRPSSEDSQWANVFGTQNRDGELQLRYMLTEDQAQALNNKLIQEANPDILLLAGDLAERGSWQTHWDEWFRYFAGDQGNLLDSLPVVTSLGNHEVYGYCEDRSRIDGCTQVVRARALYNQNFDPHPSGSETARDAYHRTDYGGVTFISLDSTKGTHQDSRDPETISDAERITGNDANLTPDQYGTDTQNSFSREQYEHSFPYSVEEGWWGPDADPTKPDQPNFMPGSEQYAWLEAQLADARDKGQVIVIQYHHVAYSNGTHGTTMGHVDHPDSQPGTPMRHLQPLFEEYDVAVVISGHDETFQASYVDEAGDGTGVWHWDVGIASDGLRGEKMVLDAETGEYVPLGFNTHSVWMAQRDEPELWATNDAGVKHLLAGGKHYGHLDIQVLPYEGPTMATETGARLGALMTMTPMAMFPILDDAYNVIEVQRRAMMSGQQVVYLDERGRPLNATILRALEEAFERPEGDDQNDDVEGSTPGAGTGEEPRGDQPAGGDRDDERDDKSDRDDHRDEKSDSKSDDKDDDRDDVIASGESLANTGAATAELLAAALIMLALGGTIVIRRQRHA